MVTKKKKKIHLHVIIILIINQKCMVLNVYGLKIIYFNVEIYDLKMIERISINQLLLLLFIYFLEPGIY